MLYATAIICGLVFTTMPITIIGEAFAHSWEEKERLKDLIDKLQKELDAQERAVAARTKRLMIEKDQYLVDLPSHGNTVGRLVEQCVFPRCDTDISRKSVSVLAVVNSLC